VNKKLSYHDSVNYSIADPAKVLAQKEGKATAKNLPYGFKEVPGTRGESAYVFDMGEMYGALVQEGLGTKSLIAQAVYKETGKSFFANIAKDTVATFINDLVSVGAMPVVSNAYWSSSSYKWLGEKKLAGDFIKGWRRACDEAKVVWGGGETQSLPGIVAGEALEFGGSAFGVIKNKKQLVSEKKLKAGDAILLIESSGVHANGISLTREIANNLDDGYQTKLKDGSVYGEVLLTPTHIYANLVTRLLEESLNIHYLSNITGHGWRKIMRATAGFTYRITEIPPVPEIFNFIAARSGNDDNEMYGTFNMGAGYAVYLPKREVTKAQVIAKDLGFKSWNAGTIEKGKKQVIIEPKDITYASESLEVR
jgi:phosphoribosylformylglycinamidine cyclo-ligase